jgi:hypothetical protein
MRLSDLITPRIVAHKMPWKTEFLYYTGTRPTQRLNICPSIRKNFSRRSGNIFLHTLSYQTKKDLRFKSDVTFLYYVRRETARIHFLLYSRLPSFGRNAVGFIFQWAKTFRKTLQRAGLGNTIFLFVVTHLGHFNQLTGDSPDDGGRSALWNVSKYLPDYTAQHPRRQRSSYSLWELKILPFLFMFTIHSATNGSGRATWLLDLGLISRVT